MIDLQLVIVLIVVAVAAGWIVCSWFRAAARAEHSGCGDCQTCPAARSDSESSAGGFVSLDAVMHSAEESKLPSHRPTGAAR